MAFATNGDCTIHYDTFGSASDPALLLVNGLGSQCINYHDDWCAMFAAAGFFVLRYDNRDVGLSSKFDGAEPYSVTDMAQDGLAVLDAERIQRAHVMGLSMGGMIVQTMAIENRERLLSMTSVMSRTGEDGYGASTPEAFELLMGPPATDRASFVEAHCAGLRVWGSPAFADEARWRRDAERAFDRCFHPSGPGRQITAVGRSGSRGELLPGVTTPTLVLHGDCDTLIHWSGGERTAALIPGARFVLIEGMGHDYPPGLWQTWVDHVVGFIRSLPG